jgi:hypothetical protein
MSPTGRTEVRPFLLCSLKEFSNNACAILRKGGTIVYAPSKADNLGEQNDSQFQRI